MNGLRRLVVCSVLWCLSPAPIHAACNLIPPLKPKAYPSEIGSIDAPIAGPGHVAEVVLTPCDAGFTPFSAVAAENVVTLTFVPPQGSTTDVALTGTPADCTGAVCRRLLVQIPDTTAAYPATAGLAGPARITVLTNGAPSARIERLYQPTTGCTRVPEGIFRRFTVLPPLNDFAGLLPGGGATRLLATLDGDDNLVIPLNYRNVLPDGVGSPVARLVTGSTGLAARTDAPGVPIQIPSSSFVRSFTTDGRPLPPLLRVNGDGNLLLGTTDGAEGILRIARNDGSQPADIYDLRSRFAGGRGPIIIDRAADGFTAETRASVPLRGLRSSAAGAVGFASDERLERCPGNPLPPCDLNADGDTADVVARVLDTSTGIVTPTGMAVTQARTERLPVPAVEVGDSRVAFLESEATQGDGSLSHDLDQDGDVFDSILRVFQLVPNAPAVERTAAVTPRLLAADPARVVNARSVAVSNGLVFFRTPEADGVPAITTRISAASGGGDANADSSHMINALSQDGRYVIFDSLATDIVPGTSGRAVFVYDRVTGAVTSEGVDGNGVQCTSTAHSAISGDGRFVAFSGACPSLPGDNVPPGGSEILVRDRCVADGAAVAGCVPSTRGVQLSEAPPPATVWSLDFPRFSLDGSTVVFQSLAIDLGTGNPTGVGHVHAWDRASGGPPTIASIATGGAPGDARSYAASTSGDGRFVTFQSSAPNLGGGNPLSDVFVHDRCISGGTAVAGCSERTDPVSRCTGGPANGQSGDAVISADGRFVAFNSQASCSPFAASGNGYDVYVYDRQTGTMEIASVDANGGIPHGQSILPSLSADGRVVVFQSLADDLVPGGAMGRANIYRHDRLTGATELVSVTTGGSAVTDCVDLAHCAQQPVVSADGRVIAFTSASDALVPGDTARVDVFVRGPIDPAVAYDLDGDGRATHTVLQVFNPVTSALRATARVAAGDVAVADGRALFLSPQPGGSVAHLYECIPSGSDPCASDAMTSLGVVATQAALSTSLLALAAPEPGRAVLATRGVQGPGLTSTGLAADALAIADVPGVVAATVAYTAPEPTAGPGGTPVDLNGDGDTTDRVLRAYTPTAALPVRTLAAAAEDFVVTGGLIAFRARECAQHGAVVSVGCPTGGTDLNGDGDADDAVMQVFDLEQDRIVSTRQAAIRCDRPGCEPGVPYKITYRAANGTAVQRAIAFLTDEAEQGGQDLNGNGIVDVVMQVFNVAAETLQVFDFAPDNSEDVPSPFPDTILGGPIVYVTVDERTYGGPGGADLNGDGVKGIVTLVVGDQDQDGSFDVGQNVDDVCTETPDPNQADDDADELGDACVQPATYCTAFTPDAPPVPPAGALACQRKVLAAALVYSDRRADAVRACLDRFATGALTGNATLTCNGTFLTGETLPTDAATAAKLQGATAKLQKTLLKCAGPLDLIETCGHPPTAPSERDRCLRAGLARAANASNEIAFGIPAALTNASARTCQHAVADGAGRYQLTLAKAVARCLDRVAAGKLSGNAAALCFGRGDPTHASGSLAAVCAGDATAVGGVVAPADGKTATAFAKAACGLRKLIARKCPAATLATPGLQTCGTTVDAVARCVECSQWRQAADAVRLLFGPNVE